MAADVESRYLIYSLTKTFIAVLFCRLAERGELSLDDPLADWSDDPRLPAATLRQLLNHTAGIPDYADAAYAAAVRERPSEPWSDEQFLAHALARPRVAEWGYSNAGYLLLRCILDRIEPGGFEAALRRELTAPLGMTQTTLALVLDDLDGLAPGLSTQLGAGTRDVRGLYHPGWVGHRTAISTAADLRRFWMALSEGKLLAGDDLLSFVDVGTDAYGFVRPTYGLGLMGDSDWPHGVLIGHGGGGPGYGAAAFALLRPEPLVAIVLKGEDGDGSAEAEAVGLLELQVTESPR